MQAANGQTLLWICRLGQCCHLLGASRRWVTIPNWHHLPRWHLQHVVPFTDQAESQRARLWILGWVWLNQNLLINQIHLYRFTPFGLWASRIELWDRVHFPSWKRRLHWPWREVSISSRWCHDPMHVPTRGRFCSIDDERQQVTIYWRDRKWGQYEAGCHSGRTNLQ